MAAPPARVVAIGRRAETAQCARSGFISGVRTSSPPLSARLRTAPRVFKEQTGEGPPGGSSLSGAFAAGPELAQGTAAAQAAVGRAGSGRDRVGPSLLEAHQRSALQARAPPSRRPGRASAREHAPERRLHSHLKVWLSAPRPPPLQSPRRACRLVEAASGSPGAAPAGAHSRPTDPQPTARPTDRSPKRPRQPGDCAAFRSHDCAHARASGAGRERHVWGRH